MVLISEDDYPQGTTKPWHTPAEVAVQEWNKTTSYCGSLTVIPPGILPQLFYLGSEDLLLTDLASVGVGLGLCLDERVTRLDRQAEHRIGNTLYLWMTEETAAKVEIITQKKTGSQMEITVDGDEVVLSVPKRLIIISNRSVKTSFHIHRLRLDPGWDHDRLPTLPMHPGYQIYHVAVDSPYGSLSRLPYASDYPEIGWPADQTLERYLHSLSESEAARIRERLGDGCLICYEQSSVYYISSCCQILICSRCHAKIDEGEGPPCPGCRGVLLTILVGTGEGDPCPYTDWTQLYRRIREDDPDARIAISSGLEMTMDDQTYEGVKILYPSTRGVLGVDIKWCREATHLITPAWVNDVVCKRCSQAGEMPLQIYMVATPGDAVTRAAERAGILYTPATVPVPRCPYHRTPEMLLLDEVDGVMDIYEVYLADLCHYVHWEVLDGRYDLLLDQVLRRHGSEIIRRPGSWEMDGKRVDGEVAIWEREDRQLNLTRLWCCCLGQRRRYLD